MRNLGLTVLGTAACVALFFGLTLESVSADEGTKTEATPDAQATEAQLTSKIDAAIAEVWKRDDVKPARASSDEEFLRRVFLDTVGTPPTADEAAAFLDDKSKDKRAGLIDKLVDDPRFGEHIADQWVTVLIGSGKSRQSTDLVLGAWIAENINAGRGFDELVYEMISVRGHMADNPAAAYLTAKNNVTIADMAGEATRHFTGVQIQCAQCHDHPYEEDWSVADFNGVAAFFYPTRMNRNGKAQPRLQVLNDRKAKFTSFAEVEKKIANTDLTELESVLKSQRYQAPKFLEGKEAKVKDAREWRATYASWVIAKENTQTHRYMANRFWSFLFGSGLLNPVDDFNSFNEASHPELLALLGEDLRAADYDVKRFYRAVLKSKTWQLSSEPAQGAEAWHFASYPVRQLTPEQFFAALLNVQDHADERRRSRPVKNPYTGMRNIAEGKDKRKQKKDVEYDLEVIKKLEAMYDGISPQWLTRRKAAARFASFSEDDEMNEASNFSLTIDQALLVMNGNETNKLADWSRGSVLDVVVSSADSEDKRLDRLFLTVLSRRPDNAERKLYVEHLKQVKDKQAAWEDVLFSLLVTTEFATNH